MSEMIALDTETWLVEKGLLAPKPVVASFFDGKEGWLERFINPFDDQCAEETIMGLMRPGLTIAGANLPYDFAVILRHMPSLMQDVFLKYERGEIFDVQVAAALDAVAEGRVTDGMVFGRNMQPLRTEGDEGKVTNRFSLANCVWLYLGRKNAKENAEFRLLYRELDGIPFDQWPPKAKQYPVDDVRNPYEVAHVMRTGRTQNIGPIGAQFRVPPPVPHTHLTHQCRAAFAMHLGSVWGFRTDPERIAAIDKKINANVETDNARFLEWGLLKVDPKGGLKENRPAIKRAVIVAYGGSSSAPCVQCKGTCQVPSEKTGKPVNCKKCDGTGLDVPLSVPHTPADGIAADRDTLEGTEDPRLEAWAAAGKNDKMRETYLPWLREGIDKPINVRPDVLKATGRCSYDGLVQLIPDLARQCIRARPGYLFFSCDYPSLELCTLAQVTYTVLGHSRMRDVINATRDPGSLHTEFGAKMAGIDTADAKAMAAFARAAKDKGTREAGLRQMAKAANFGFPGLMGPATFVTAKRAEGLRLCVVSGMNTVCAKPVMEWEGKKLDKPTCPDCLDVATRLRAEWFKAWPEIPAYFSWVSSLREDDMGGKVIVTPVTGYVRSGMTAASAANHSFQHLGAMAAKEALWHVTKEAYSVPESPLYGTRPLILVHDEIWGETPISKAHDAAYRVCRLMCEALRKFCPDIDVPEPEPALSQYWYKKATLVKGEDGRLLPWEPVDKDGKPVAWAP